MFAEKINLMMVSDVLIFNLPKNIKAAITVQSPSIRNVLNGFILYRQLVTRQSVTYFLNVDSEKPHNYE